MAASPSEFDQAFRDHAAFVWRVLVRHGIAAADLEDVSQEVFLTLHRKLPQFERRSSLRTFIYGICRGLSANYRRREPARRELVRADPQALLDAVAASGDGEPFQALASKQSRALLEALLARLTPEQREVFVLYELEELSMREVAEALDCSENTCFSRLYAARRDLAAELARLRAKRRVA